jgi:hypothetical protein
MDLTRAMTSSYRLLFQVCLFLLMGLLKKAVGGLR